MDDFSRIIKAEEKQTNLIIELRKENAELKKKVAELEGQAQEQPVDKSINSNKIICPKCHEEVDDGNFCSKCRAKLHDTCKHCWLKQGQPYNCGFEKCPGYKLPLKEKK